jgi:rhodanese-related sulfurtransferase
MSSTMSEKLCELPIATLMVLSLLIVSCSQRPADNPARAAAVNELYQTSRQAFPDVPEITIAAAAGDDSAVFVDVREPAEIVVSRIAGAISVAEFEAARSEYRDRQIVTYCTIGYRSGKYAEQLRNDGFEAYNLSGSILGWVHDRRELVDPDGKWIRRLHVYGRKWDLAPTQYETVW